LTVIAIVGLGFDPQEARGKIVEEIRGVVGQEVAVVIEQLVAQSAISNHGIWSGIIAAITLFIGSTGLFSSLQDALNTIWMTPGKKVEGGIIALIRERFLAFLLVCITAILLIASLVISTILTGINARVSSWLPESAPLAELINFAINYALTTTLFAMMFKWLPEIRLAWSDVLLGAVITSGLIALGRYPIGFYLHKVSVGSAFGAAEAFVVFLIWIYYSTHILLFGAELTFVYSTRNKNEARIVESVPETMAKMSAG
jgi:membrane protein